MALEVLHQAGRRAVVVLASDDAVNQALQLGLRNAASFEFSFRQFCRMTHARDAGSGRLRLRQQHATVLC